MKSVQSIIFTILCFAAFACLLFLFLFKLLSVASHRPMDALRVVAYLHLAGIPFFILVLKFRALYTNMTVTDADNSDPSQSI